ncbi:hypothetical protein GCM10023350_21790 [Nocardioides endophyticus]|uniref:Uncharacterized protein n=1 Tax=Nocardioides endophyticus TaxID=1353775 RepID=A0ABP8YU92_9ACTN
MERPAWEPATVAALAEAGARIYALDLDSAIVSAKTIVGVEYVPTDVTGAGSVATALDQAASDARPHHLNYRWAETP